MVKGSWDTWGKPSKPWSKFSRKLSTEIPGPGSVQRIGWVARLFSGVSRLEKKGAAYTRQKARSAGLTRLLAAASHIAVSDKFGYNESTLMWFDEEALEKNRETYHNGTDDSLNKLVKRLFSVADAELASNAVYSVVHKPKPGPSGDIHDYLSASPYHWPNPSKPDGIPFRYRDGKRTPETQLYSKESNVYDRTRISMFARNVTVLTLAGYFSGESAYFEKAVSQVRTWFIDEATRMNPNLKYAQMQFTSHHDVGASTGMLDFQNIVIVLDCVKILYKCRLLSDQDMASLRHWTADYLKFLQDSPQGQQEYESKNNHGTLYDSHISAVAAFTDNYPTLEWHTRVSRGRMKSQFDRAGKLIYEMRRPNQLHYMMYGLQAWVWLARISERIGVDLWNFSPKGEEKSYMERGMKFCVPYFARPLWEHAQSGSEDMSRMLFLYYHAKRHFPNMEEFTKPDQLGRNVLPVPDSIFDVEPIVHDYYLVPPFWNLVTNHVPK